MKLPPLKLRFAGTSLVETMVALGVVSAVLLALVIGSLTLQHQFFATSDYATSQNEQVRALDYIDMDLRRATAINQATGGIRLNLTLPNYYQTIDGVKKPRNPVKAGGRIDYGSGSVSVTYRLDGTDLVRTENGVSTTIATNVESFKKPTVDGKTVTTTITFQSRMKRKSTTPVTLSSKTPLRNIN